MSFLEDHEQIADLLARAGLGKVPPRTLVQAVVAVAVIAGVAAWRWWPSGSEAGVVSHEPPAPVQVSAEASSPVQVVVHVAGAVLRPGVYELPAGSRVRDAVARAGGLLGSAAASAVNLARVLEDGEQVYFPTQDEAANGTGPGGTASNGIASDGRIDINRADAATLETLPGIGPATAQKIVAEREANGPFASVEDLMRVPGIGEKRVAALAELVVVR